VNAGNLRGALYGAFSAAAFHGVGTYFSNIKGAAAKNLGRFGNFVKDNLRLTKTIAHGLTGGIMNELQGGKFAHGFLSAGATQALAPSIESIGIGDGALSFGDRALRVAAAAAVGGTVSEVTGGKFANGAVAGAFSRGFGDIARDQSVRVGGGAESESVLDLSVEERQALLRTRLDEMWEAGELRTWHTFASPDAAAIEVLDLLAPLSRRFGLELAGHIRPVDGGYRYTRPQIGGATGATLNTRYTGYHTHPSGTLRFTNDDFNLGTGNDARWVRIAGKALYLGVQSGSGAIGIAACEPGNCNVYGRTRVTGRTVRGF